MSSSIVVLGAFFVDLVCRTKRMPVWGETIHGRGFSISSGGKGSNQAVAIARQGGHVELITRIGDDLFGQMAHSLFADEKIGTQFVIMDSEAPTGTATILVEDETGKNFILISPGACENLSAADIDQASGVIEKATFFVSQLELNLASCLHGINLAYKNSVPVLLNPAPAIALPESLYAKLSYFTPNETEATMLTGIAIKNVDDAKNAASCLHQRGVPNVIITLGETGAYVSGQTFQGLIPAYPAGPVCDTTGAGDAFNGGFVVALSQGAGLAEAAKFGCMVAGISVTRAGAAASMPKKFSAEDFPRAPST